MHKKLYSLELIEMMSGGDEAFIQKMIGLFLTQTPELLIRLKAAWASNNHNEIKLSAHKLISSIDMMEIDSLKPVVREIEKMGAKKNPVEEIKIEIEKLENTLRLILRQLQDIHTQKTD